MNRWAVLCISALFSTGLHAAAPCPTNVEPVTFHNSPQHQMIVPVSINHAGPYNFLLDTGTQMTVVDQSLASELHIATSGNVNVAGVSIQGQTKYAQIDRLELGSLASTNQKVLVYNMKGLQKEGFAIRGLLGEDFLSRFDVLIDNTHNVLCMDDTGAMQAAMQGAQDREGK